jgi:5-methylcytosine-specific restriction endonuclease McrA
MNKTCRKCNLDLPLEDFTKDKRRKDGRGSYCRPCANKNVALANQRHPETRKLWYEANRETILEKQRTYLLDPEVQERARRVKAAYAAQNVERFREWKAKWRESNPEYHINWERANRKRARQLKRKSEAKRRAKKRGLLAEDVCPEEIFNRDSGVCGICLAPVDPSNWHLDHIVPLALGGPHVSENVQVTHPLCNMRKGSRLAA